jgi:hypothetical protein
MSTVSKGNYYKDKTKKWYEKHGYTVQITEFMCGRQIPGGRIVYQKRDVFGSDGIAMNGKEIIFWNSKSTTEERVSGLEKHKSEGKIEFNKFPFPENIKRHVVVWQPRKKPKIYELDETVGKGSKEIKNDFSG